MPIGNIAVAIFIAKVWGFKNYEKELTAFNQALGIKEYGNAAEKIADKIRETMHLSGA